jgi:hypothetical protein
MDPETFQTIVGEIRVFADIAYKLGWIKAHRDMCGNPNCAVTPQTFNELFDDWISQGQLVDGMLEIYKPEGETNGQQSTQGS